MNCPTFQVDPRARRFAARSHRRRPKPRVEKARATSGPRVDIKWVPFSSRRVEDRVETPTVGETYWYSGGRYRVTVVSRSRSWYRLCWLPTGETFNEQRPFLFRTAKAAAADYLWSRLLRFGRQYGRAIWGEARDMTREEKLGHIDDIGEAALIWQLRAEPA